MYKVWNLVAPSPSDASLYDGGTTFKASSVVRIITGKIIIARVKDPAISEYPNFNVVTKNAAPNNPYTIDGIPARASVEYLIILTNRPCLAYSCK